MLEGVVPFPPDFAKRYRERGYWRDLSLRDEFAAMFARHADRVAFIDRGKTFTYAAVDRTAERLALNLLELGIRPLDRIVVQLPNVIEFVFLYFALQKIGALRVIDQNYEREAVRTMQERLPFFGDRKWISVVSLPGDRSHFGDDATNCFSCSRSAGLIGRSVRFESAFSNDSGFSLITTVNSSSPGLSLSFSSGMLMPWSTCMRLEMATSNPRPCRWRIRDSDSAASTFRSALGRAQSSVVRASVPMQKEGMVS